MRIDIFETYANSKNSRLVCYCDDKRECPRLGAEKQPEISYVWRKNVHKYWLTA